MAHVRKDSSKPTTTISLEQELLVQIENYRFSKRKDNRSQAIADLVLKGLKYVELQERKREKNRVSSLA